MKGRLEDGTPVIVLGRGDLRGIVAGITKKVPYRNNDWFYLVDLAEGFWNEGRTCYVSLLVVHPEQIEKRFSEDV